MKRFAFILLSGLLATTGHADEYAECFIPGEVIEYKVSWMGIPLAWSKTTTEEFIEGGQSLVRIRMQSKTYKAYSHIYKIDDLTEVIVDPKTALPKQLDFKLNEGGRSKNHLTIFDHENLNATFIDRNAQTTNSVTIQSDTKDVLTFLYSIRKTPLEHLAENVHTLFVDGKIHEMGLQVGKDRTMKVPYFGKVASTEVEPVAEFDALFLREGKIFFWISKEKRRVITCVNAKVAVGKVRVKLESVSGPGDDFWASKSEEK